MLKNVTKVGYVKPIKIVFIPSKQLSELGIVTSFIWVDDRSVSSPLLSHVNVSPCLSSRTYMNAHVHHLRVLVASCTYNNPYMHTNCVCVLRLERSIYVPLFVYPAFLMHSQSAVIKLATPRCDIISSSLPLRLFIP